MSDRPTNAEDGPARAPRRSRAVPAGGGRTAPGTTAGNLARGRPSGEHPRDGQITVMDRKARFYARQLFELRVRQSKGEAYQDLFNRIMQLCTPEFVPMRPYGKVGDRKNDGYNPSTGTFYQVYAPLDPGGSFAQAVAKAKRDFTGLYAHWSATHPVREYRFAFNDEYRGSNVPLEDALAEIALKHGISARAFLAKDLETEAFALPAEQLERAIDVLVPDPSEIVDADFAAVRDVVQYIMRSDAPDPPKGKLLAPDFNVKIQFNRLTDMVGDLLRVAGRQSGVVDDFFSRRSGGHRQDLRDHLAELYLRLRTEAGDGSADSVFFDLLEALQPPQRRRDRPIQNAALIVMSYYFEACDIFDSPDAPA